VYRKSYFFKPYEPFIKCVDLDNNKIRRKMAENIAARLKKVCIPLDEETLPEILEIISHHVKNISFLEVWGDKSFTFKLMKESKKTLQEVELYSTFNPKLWHLTYPRLEKITLETSEMQAFLNICISDNLPSLKTVIFTGPIDNAELGYIFETYPSKCIVCHRKELISSYPFPMGAVPNDTNLFRNSKNLKVLNIKTKYFSCYVNNFSISEIRTNLPNVTEIFFSVDVSERHIWEPKIQEVESAGIKIISEKTWNQRKEEFANDEWWIEIQ
jgi:hypothetical protein